MQASGSERDSVSSPQSGSRHWWLMWLPPLIGVAAVVWFLVRVIPKPSRAAYPCQRAAFPIASSFIVWLLVAVASLGAWHRFRHYFRRGAFALAALCLVASAIGGMVLFHDAGQPTVSAAPIYGTEGANNVYGTAKGLFPGRVVWVNDPNATSGEVVWNPTVAQGYWWDANHTNQAVVNDMMSKSIRWLTSRGGDSAAWDALFENFNSNRGLARGYQSGEKIAIKCNWNNSGNYASKDNASDVTPQVLKALLSQLVNQAGVPQDCIYVYDSMRYCANEYWDVCHGDFPNVHYVDYAGQNGREAIVPSAADQIKYSNGLILPDKLPTIHLAADYFINLAVTKRSHMGQTAIAKNTFGSLNPFNPDHGGVPDSQNLHGYIDLAHQPYGQYNALVDHLGHKELGGKCLLYVSDAIWGGYIFHPSSGSMPRRWNLNALAPLGISGTDYLSSLFVSQDPVAIESVTLDMIYKLDTTDLPNYADNYLHEAAKANNPPSGTVYDPEQDGTRLASLGAHEHWDANLQYSRDKGTGDGIALIRSQPALVGEVVARKVFYNNSYHDTSGNAAGIATDKSALLPGQAASFANYTSFSKGINGIIVDIAGGTGSITASDLSFKTGNGSLASNFTAAAAAPTVSVAVGAGAGGSTRVTITFADGAIKKTWLQVTVKANGNTGLTTADVFYFGNAVGDTGNSVSNTYVNASDAIGARDHTVTFPSRAAITNRYDFNRDGYVNGTDVIIARDNTTNFLKALKLITAP